MGTFDRVFSKPCEKAHADANMKARLSAKYLCAQVKFEMAVIKINEALSLIESKRVDTTDRQV